MGMVRYSPAPSINFSLALTLSLSLPLCLSPHLRPQSQLNISTNLLFLLLLLRLPSLPSPLPFHPPLPGQTLRGRLPIAKGLLVDLFPGKMQQRPLIDRLPSAVQAHGKASIQRDRLIHVEGKTRCRLEEKIMEHTFFWIQTNEHIMSMKAF